MQRGRSEALKGGHWTYAHVVICEGSSVPLDEIDVAGGLEVPLGRNDDIFVGTFKYDSRSCAGRRATARGVTTWN